MRFANNLNGHIRRLLFAQIRQRVFFFLTKSKSEQCARSLVQALFIRFKT